MMQTVFFSFINNAYEILGDMEKRRLHDASLPIGEVINVDGEGNYDEDIDDDNDSDDHSDNDGINVDEDRPPEKDRILFPCDWEKVFNFCYTPGLQPFKCTTDGCNKFVHRICQKKLSKDMGTVHYHP